MITTVDYTSTAVVCGILLGVLMACSPRDEVPEQISFFNGTPAQWISDARALPQFDSLYYENRPAPYFRKIFQTNGEISQAKLIITAAGYYLAYINGQMVGKNVLDPAWTDYSKRIYYTQYDVTTMLRKKTNSFGVILGNGFYNPLPMRKWGRRNLREDMIVGKPTFLLKLIVDYKDGSSQEIVSDSSWKYTYGPIMKNSVYIGVDYDARKELTGWQDLDYDDQSWEQAIKQQGPVGQLQASFFPSVQVTREIKPKHIYTLPENIFMVDMGENFTGTFKMKIHGETGDTISFRFGERVYEDGSINTMTSVIGQIKRPGVGGPGAPDTAWQTDQYIIGDHSDTWFQPPFTYHTFRYMEVKGLQNKPSADEIRGLFLHSNVSNPNHFTSSSELLNTIQNAVERTFLSNLISVQSDCPAREKFGYGGDINATSESFIYNFDMQAMYRKTVYDWVDAMNDTGFVDTAPFVGIQYCGISWESAYLLTQYYVYLYYNDLQMVEEHYEQNRQWMDKVARLHPNGIVEQGLSDHESLEPVPVELTGTCHYLQCARIMTRFAQLMDDLVREKQYEQLAENLKSIVREKYWQQPIQEAINKQTLYATLLYHDIVPSNQIAAARDSLIQAVQNGPSGHFNTGIFGTKYILEVLSEFVSPQWVFDIVNSTEFPGWGYMIDQGATTIWETWKESDNVYSNCHPMFGTVTEWYYRWLAGIRPDPEHPGFGSFLVAPFIPDGLDSVQCTYHSPGGPIVSKWWKYGVGNYRFEIHVPAQSIASVKLPIPSGTEIGITKNQEKIDPGSIPELKTGQFELTGGRYVISTITDK